MVRRIILTLLSCLASFSATEQIVDSEISLGQALEGTSAPVETTDRLVIISVDYYSTDGKLHRRQIIVDSTLRTDIEQIFAYAMQIRYPIDMVVPIKFDLPNNGTTMANLNNSYSFHYRAKAGNSKSLSRHSYGRAIDINPFNNPYISSSGRVIPAAGQYDTNDSRALTAEHPLVKKFISLGWIWGGNWSSPKDYMHFEKPLKTK